MTDWIGRLEAFWSAQSNPVVSSGASVDEIARCAERLRVCFPPPFVELMRAANGFGPPHAQDDEGYCLWSLDQLARVRDCDGGGFAYAGCEAHVIFFDYLVLCWAFAIDCDPESPTFGAVYVTFGGDEGARLVAPDLPAFMALYRADDATLYPQTSLQPA